MLIAQIYNDGENWGRVLCELGRYDFTHTYDYYAANATAGGGSPLIFVVRNGDGDLAMCWPTIKRQIEGYELFDLTGVHADSGPLYNGTEPLDLVLAAVFKKMRAIGIVTLFSRTHPLFTNNLDVDILRTEYWGDGIFIDLKEQNEPMKGYRSNHKRDIRNAKKRGVTAIYDFDCKNIPEFMDIYTKAMLKLGVEQRNILDESFIRSVVTARNYKSMFVFAALDGIKIGAMLLTETNDIFNYYLGGVVDEYKALSPLKFMISSAHELAIEKGLGVFYLGDGPGGPEHPLIKFKMGFSHSTVPLYICKKIIDQKKYDKICKEKGINQESTDYMPAYRDPAYI